MKACVSVRTSLTNDAPVRQLTQRWENTGLVSSAAGINLLTRAWQSQ